MIVDHDTREPIHPVLLDYTSQNYRFDNRVRIMLVIRGDSIEETKNLLAYERRNAPGQLWRMLEDATGTN